MARTGRPKGKADELLPRQRLFLNNYLNMKNATKAAEAAGYSSPASAGCELLKNPKVAAAIEANNVDMRQMFVREAIGALKVLIEVAKDGRNELARVKAADSILDRAGYKAVEQQNITGTVQVISTSIDYNNPDALLARLEELRQRRDTIDVLPISDANGVKTEQPNAPN
jgi:phage terminase small subunit